eukprot:7364150-Ditylum_brightwellii.AAC.1
MCRIPDSATWLPFTWYITAGQAVLTSTTPAAPSYAGKMLPDQLGTRHPRKERIYIFPFSSNE